MDSSNSSPIRIAPFYAHVEPTDIRVLSAYENKDKLNQWVRGSIKKNGQDLIVTGPKMRVCYSGCRWNKISFAMPGIADADVYAFERWIKSLAAEVESIVWENPEKFKPGAKTNSRFTFERDIIRPSSDPASYPDELRCNLSTYRLMNLTGENVGWNEGNGELSDRVVDADLFTMHDGEWKKINPTDIMAGSYVIPVIKFSYFRNIERFGLTLTVLRGHVFPRAQDEKISNDEWVIDYPMDTSA